MKTQTPRMGLVITALCASMAVTPARAFPEFLLDSGVEARPAAAVEYYYAAKDQYFVTTSQSEMAVLEGGAIAGWQRVGNGEAFLTFNEPVTVRGVEGGQGAAQPVCRFYIPPASHFMSASVEECAAVASEHPEFVFETDAAFYAWLPDATTGRCPQLAAKIGGFVFQPVYRLWNNRADTNHRLTTSPLDRVAMIEQGWVSEGYGDEGVAMCVPRWY